MSTTTEPFGTLTYEDDEEVLHKFRVSVAEYNLYVKDGQGWLTLYCATDQKISPADDLPAEPWMEISVPLAQPRDELKPGDKIAGSAYDDAFGGWLTNFYYYSHSGFEQPEIIIQEVDSQSILAEIRGEGDDSPVVISARFTRNSNRHRSVT
jgi:hypothetical protein